jgi:hypothetical protein
MSIAHNCLKPTIVQIIFKYSVRTSKNATCLHYKDELVNVQGDSSSLHSELYETRKYKM